MSDDIVNNKLTPKEDRFCYEYLACGLNATKAALKAGYSKKTAAIIGFENLRKPKIKSRIDEMRENLAETAGITSLMIVNEHAKIAFTSIAHLHNSWITLKEFEQLTEDQKSCIQEISTKVLKVRGDDDRLIDVEYVKIKLFDKQKALDSLTNMLGFSGIIKNDITSNGQTILIKLPEPNE